MIDDASRISGDIVLRAAKRGVSAGELMGLVLSRGLVAEEFGRHATVAWFLLDDYAEWLGQREQGIADILALSVAQDADGKATLRAVVTEAKYVGADAAADARRTSKQQLRQTVQRMEDALFGDPGRLDRDLWLSRIADPLLDGTTAVGQTRTLEMVRDAIRHGAVPIDLRGYSHVFVSGPGEAAPITAEQEPIPEICNGLQELFAREDLRNLIKAYEAGTSLTAVRQSLGDHRPWTTVDLRDPAPKVNWISAQTSSPPDSSGRGLKDSNVPTSPAREPPPPSGSIAGETADLTAARHEVQTGATRSDVVQTEFEDFRALVAGHATHRSAASAADAIWLDSTAQKLRTALQDTVCKLKLSAHD